MNKSLHSVERWSRFHAILLLIGLGTYWNTRVIGLLPIISLVSFGYLLYTHRSLLWTETDSISRANLITLLRHDGIIFLVFFSKSLPLFTIGVLASLLAILDGFDGYYARKDQNATWFGGYLDKETDALFVMMMTLMIYDHDLVSWWVLLLGALRYIYVLILPYLKSAGKPEPRSSFGRVNAVILMVGLIGCFILTFEWYQYVFTVVAALTFYSFLSSFWYWLRMRIVDK